MSEQPRVLIVEDDLELAEWIAEYLQDKGYDVSAVHCGKQAVDVILAQQPDLVILDGMLPKLDGLDVCKAVRPKFSNPILMLTARDEELDEVLGLEVGADDYMTKPVRARVLLARVRKHLDRVAKDSSVGEKTINEKLVFDRLSIDSATRSVVFDDERLDLSSKEFDILWLLAQNAGQIISRDFLVKQLRGFDYDGYDRSIDLLISRLRKKLGDNSSESGRIKTVWGKGYLFVKDSH